MRRYFGDIISTLLFEPEGDDKHIGFVEPSTNTNAKNAAAKAKEDGFDLRAIVVKRALPYHANGHHWGVVMAIREIEVDKMIRPIGVQWFNAPAYGQLSYYEQKDLYLIHKALSTQEVIEKCKE